MNAIGKILPDDAPHLMLVDDDRRIRDLLSRYLAEQGPGAWTHELQVVPKGERWVP